MIKDVHNEFHNQVYIMRSIAIMFYASTQLRTYGRHLSSSLGQTDRIELYTEFYDEVYKIRGIWIIFYRSTQLRTPKNISIRSIHCTESSLHLLIYWRHMTKDGILRYCHIAKKHLVKVIWPFRCYRQIHNVAYFWLLNTLLYPFG